MNRKKVCWKITSSCNQGCKYCFRVLGSEDLTYEENKKILMKLVDDGITDITWNGGEPLMYPHLFDLLKLAKENGIKNKLITNGKLLLNFKDSGVIEKYVDNLTVSLDTVNDEINKELGGDSDYLKNIKNIFEFTKSKGINLNINTVVNRKNLNELSNLGSFLDNYNVNTWKLIEFSPFRETAKKNEEEFKISRFDFEKTRILSSHYKNIRNFEFRTTKELEQNNLIIIPNGDIVKTIKGQDIKLGNALYNNVSNYIDNMERRNSNMNKIRTLIAYDDKDFKEEIINLIKGIDGAEIVGIAGDGEETYQKIVDLKPEMVFAKFDLEKMDGLEIIKKSKENLESSPIFNIISDRALGSDLEEMVKIAGKNLNALINEDDHLESRVKSIYKDYIELKNV